LEVLVSATLSVPARALAQASVIRALIAQIKDPSAETVLALEPHLTRLARPEDIDRYLAAMRACPATAEMLEAHYLPSPYTLDDLSVHAPGSLGAAYKSHMVENDLSPDYFQKPLAPEDTKDGEDFAYARLRFYQTHDIWHAVTGYPTSVLGEVGIVGFYLGHFEAHMGDRAASAIGFTAILASTMLMHAALFRQDRITHFYRALFDGWTRGRAAKPFFAMRWEEQWGRPLAEIRGELAVPPRAA
jgi:ubiquinone biosynthesis protein COQ4